MAEKITAVKGKEEFEYTPGSSVVFKSTANILNESSLPNPTYAQEKILYPGPLSPWGSDNLFPQNVMKDVKVNTLILPKFKARLNRWIGRGTLYGYVTYDEMGEEVFKPVHIPEVNDFLKRTNDKRYLMESGLSSEIFGNVFTEIRKTADGSKIAAVANIKAGNVRLEKADMATGDIKNCYVSGNYGFYGGMLPPDAVVLPMIDPYYDPVSVMMARKELKFVYHTSVSSPDNFYYAEAPWNVIRNSKWLDVAVNIPKFKAALMKFQMSIKYQVHIADWYWKTAFEGFDSWDIPKKIATKEKFKAEVEANLMGQDNAGKTIMTEFKSQIDNGKEMKAILVEAIDDKIKSGLYLEDSQEATSHILSAIDYDPALAGGGPGKAMGSGSGSDKWAALYLEQLSAPALENIIYENYNNIRDYNGWAKSPDDGSDLQFRMQGALVSRSLMEMQNKSGKGGQEQKTQGN